MKDIRRGVLVFWSHKKTSEDTKLFGISNSGEGSSLKKKKKSLMLSMSAQLMCLLPRKDPSNPQLGSEDSNGKTCTKEAYQGKFTYFLTRLNWLIFFLFFPIDRVFFFLVDFVGQSKCLYPKEQ